MFTGTTTLSLTCEVFVVFKTRAKPTASRKAGGVDEKNLHHSGAEQAKPNIPWFGWVNKGGNGELFMETSDSKFVKRLTKRLIGVIVLLTIFTCGFATIVLHFSKDGFDTNVFVLICCLAGLPLIGFIVFLLMAKEKTIAFNLKEAEEKIQKLSEVIDSNATKIKKEIQKLSGATESISTKAENEIKKLSEDIKSISTKAENEIKKLSEDIEFISTKAEKKIQKLSGTIESISEKVDEKIQKLLKDTDSATENAMKEIQEQLSKTDSGQK